MLIRKLYLENFKSYEEQTIWFNEGTNAIVGPNGAGKSSILEAIGFVLFNYLRLSRQAELLREGASSGTVLVRFQSSFDEREYEVERIFGPQGTIRYRVYDFENGSQVLAEGVEDVQNWLRRHLGIAPDAKPQDLFQNTIGVPQGSFTAPFLLPSSDRKRIFDPLLQVDEYERAYQYLRETVRYLEDQANSLKQEIARLEGSLIHLPDRQAALEATEASLASLEIQFEQIDAALRKARAALRHWETAEKALRQAEQDYTEAHHRLDSAQQEQRKSQEAVAEAESAQALVAAAEPGYRAYQKASDQFHALEDARRVRDDLQRQFQQLQVSHAQKKSQRDQLIYALAQIQETKAKMETLRPRVEEQRRLQSALEDAQQKAQILPEIQRQIQKTQKELEEAITQLQAIEKALAQGAEIERQLEVLHETIAQWEEQALQHQKRCLTLQQELEHLDEQRRLLLQDESARCPTCEAELSPERREALLKRNQERRQEVVSALGEAQRQLEESRKERDAQQEKRETLERRLRALPSAEERERQQTRVARYRQELENLCQRLAELEVWAQTSNSLAQQLQALGDPALEYSVLEKEVAKQEQYEQQLAVIEQDLQHLEEDLERLAQQVAQFGDLDAAAQAIRREMEIHRASYDTFLRYIEVAQQLEERQAHLERINQQVALLLQAFQKASHALEEARAAYDAEQHAETRLQVEQLGAELSRARTQLENQREQKARLQQEIAHLKALEQTLQETRAKHEEVLSLNRLLEEIRKLIQQAGPYVTEQFVAHISQNASIFYSDIMNDYYNRLEWSSDYDLTLEVNGRRREFQQLSGGEQMGAALALRLALLRHLSEIDIAFLDEPTAHLDPERRDGLAEKIMQVKGFSQLFVISHDDTFERAAQSYIRVVKEGSTSRVETSYNV